MSFSSGVIRCSSGFKHEKFEINFLWLKVVFHMSHIEFAKSLSSFQQSPYHPDRLGRGFPHVNAWGITFSHIELARVGLSFYISIYTVEGDVIIGHADTFEMVWEWLNCNVPRIRYCASCDHLECDFTDDNEICEECEDYEHMYGHRQDDIVSNHYTDIQFEMDMEELLGQNAVCA
jgi:hypothetical protein